MAKRKKGKSIYLNVKDLELLADLLYNDVHYSPEESKERTEAKGKVISKLLYEEPLHTPRMF